MNMGDIVLTIGGVTVLLGLLDLSEFLDDSITKKRQKSVLKIVGGAIVAGIGVLMKYFGT